MVRDRVFDAQATAYDAWYETPFGRAAFAEEVDALRPLLVDLPHLRVEMGVKRAPENVQDPSKRRGLRLKERGQFRAVTSAPRRRVETNERVRFHSAATR